MSCYCYILQCADGTFYTGWTTDPERRVVQHNKGVGAKYTSARRPVKLLYLESLATRADAMKRELAIKKMTRAQKSKLIEEGAKNSPKFAELPQERFKISPSK